jgi:hypothetical protein
MAYLGFPNPTPIFPVLPPLAWSVHKKPIMSSRATTSASGRGNQLACAVYPRWSFLLTYGGDSWLRDQTQNITPGPNELGFSELTQISGLFLQCLGSYGEFFYSDPDDNSRTLEYEGTGDGTTTAFPLYFSWGGNVAVFGISPPYFPLMTLPVQGVNAIAQVTIDGTPLSPSLYSLDSTRTVLVFTSAPASMQIIEVSFSFYFRCHFLDDNLTFSQWARNLWELKEVKFESVKP